MLKVNKFQIKSNCLHELITRCRQLPLIFTMWKNQISNKFLKSHWTQLKFSNHQPASSIIASALKWSTKNVVLNNLSRYSETTCIAIIIIAVIGNGMFSPSHSKQKIINYRFIIIHRKIFVNVLTNNWWILKS